MSNNRQRLVRKLKHKQFLSEYPYDINSMYPYMYIAETTIIPETPITPEVESVSTDIVLLKRHELISERKRIIKEQLNSVYNKKNPN